jgi:hypothetical protein
MKKWLLFVVVGLLLGSALVVFLLAVPNTRNQLEERVNDGPWAILDLISDERSLHNVFEGLWDMLTENTSSSQARAWAGNAWVSVVTNEFDLDGHIDMAPDAYNKLVDRFLIQKYEASQKDPRKSAQAGILLRQRTSPEAIEFVRLQQIPNIGELIQIVESNP